MPRSIAAGCGKSGIDLGAHEASGKVVENEFDVPPKGFLASDRKRTARPI